MKTPTRASGEALLSQILETLEDQKAQDVISIPLSGKSALADAMVIASGRSDRHVKAIAERLMRELKDAGFGTCRTEGLAHGDWVLIDAGDVVVHVFRPEVRDFYNLERMWSANLPAEQVAV